MKKNKQLGQGLGALLTPSKNNLEDFNQSSILLSKIKPNPNQPRKNFAALDFSVSIISLPTFVDTTNSSLF